MEEVVRGAAGQDLGGNEEGKGLESQKKVISKQKKGQKKSRKKKNKKKKVVLRKLLEEGFGEALTKIQQKGTKSAS